VRFADLFKDCVELFRESRQSGSSHAIFKTPRAGDPRINIQNDKGQGQGVPSEAGAFVRQVLLAIDKLKEIEREKRSEQRQEQRQED
jgi:hypothetical protein